MFENIPILSLITFFPALAAVFLMVISRVAKTQEAKDQLAKNSPLVALLVSGVVFVLSLLLVFAFDGSTADFQFTEDTAWLGGGIEYRMGVDGISILFVLLTAFLTPLCILASQTSIKDRIISSSFIRCWALCSCWRQLSGSMSLAGNSLARRQRIWSCSCVSLIFR